MMTTIRKFPFEEFGEETVTITPLIEGENHAASLAGTGMPIADILRLKMNIPAPEALEIIPERRFTLEEMIAREEAAFIRGREEAEHSFLRTKEQQKNHLQTIADQIAQQIEHLCITIANRQLTLTEPMQTILWSLLKKCLMGATPPLEQHYIAETLRSAMCLCNQEHQLTVTMPANLSTYIEEILPTIKAKTGYQGHIAINALSGDDVGSCKVEWQDGYITFDEKRFYAELETLLQTMHTSRG
jgi:hypothetical protein